MTWQTFWTERTGQVIHSLRRFRFPAEDEGLQAEDKCPLPGGYGYHNVVVSLGEYKEALTEEGFLTALSPQDYLGESRWPTHCPCGYEFRAEDEWQVNQEPIYRRLDTGDTWPQKSLPVGALYDAFWNPTSWKNEQDGLALTVILPPDPEPGQVDSRGRAWNMDGPANTGGQLKPKAGTRTGDPRAVPPTVSATPSIQTNDYHGYLTNGILSDPV